MQWQKPKQNPKQNPKMEPLKVGPPAEIVAIFTGGDIRIDEALAQLKHIKERGISISLAFSRTAEAVAGLDRVLGQLEPVSMVREGEEHFGFDLVDRSGAVLVPVMSLATAARVAALMPDTLASNLIVHALLKGKKVIAARDSVFCCGAIPASLPFALRRKAEEHLSVLGSYGVAVTEVARLAEEVEKALMTPGQSTPVAVRGTKAPAAVAVSSPTAAPTALPVSSAVAAPCPQTQGEECSACGQCVSRNAESARQIIEKGADRISQAPGGFAGGAGAGRELAAVIDHTLLKPDATAEQVTRLCEEAGTYEFASVCVNPSHVTRAAKLLKGTPIKVCTVIGFPLGATTPATKALETRDAIANGAQEVDMVINVGALKSGDYDLVKRDIQGVVDAAAGKATVKVILETGVKASGGIRDFETAQKMIRAGATRIGASASVAIVKGAAKP